MLESKNVHNYFDAVDSGDISQLNDMSFGEETHSNAETAGNVTQINGKYVKPICNNVISSESFIEFRKRL